MSGFVRGMQPSALNRAELTASVIEFVGEIEIASILGEADPFLVAHNCTNPVGHFPIRERGSIVCGHCSKVFWR